MDKMGVQKLYDLKYFRDLAEGDEDFVMEMTSYFLTHCPEMMDRINNAIKDENWYVIKSVSHKFCSELIMMGMKSIHEKMDRVEKLSEEKSGLAEIKSLNDEANKELRTACQQMRDDLKL